MKKPLEIHYLNGKEIKCIYCGVYKGQIHNELCKVYKDLDKNLHRIYAEGVLDENDEDHG